MGFFNVANFDLFSCHTSYHVIEEEVYSEECTVHFEDLCEPHGSAPLDLPGSYGLVQFRKKRDVSTQVLPGYPYPAQEILSPSKCRRIAQCCHQKVPHTQCAVLSLLSTVGLYLGLFEKWSVALFLWRNAKMLPRIFHK